VDISDPDIFPVGAKFLFHRFIMARHVFSRLLFPICCCLVFPFVLSAQEGGGKPPIYLGQSCALTGPAMNLGVELRAGLRAALAESNRQGGIDGREVILLSADDGYEPYRAVENTQRLIEQEDVFLMIGAVGTPTSEAVIALTEKKKIPFFAPYSGAELLRNPFRKYVVNIRGSYYQEMEKVVAYYVEKLGLERLACFHQNDSFGRDGLHGAEMALAKRGLKLVSTGTYERNTVAVLGGMNDIFEGNPQAVLLVGTYAACAEFIKLSKLRHGKNIHFSNISFVGSSILKESLGAAGENVIISQVVPFPWDNSIPLVREYAVAMQTYQHDTPLGFTSLEGYIAGRLFSAIAREVRGELTRESFIETMAEVGRFDLAGVVMEFGPDDHQGLDQVELTAIYPEFKVVE
jgi:ABC-type branched-subunit amino acid transport system substrate-binding protein